jgi:hypothetical protein
MNHVFLDPLFVILWLILVSSIAIIEQYHRYRKLRRTKQHRCLCINALKFDWLFGSITNYYYDAFNKEKFQCMKIVGGVTMVFFLMPSITVLVVMGTVIAVMAIEVNELEIQSEGLEVRLVGRTEWREEEEWVVVGEMD